MFLHLHKNFLTVCHFGKCVIWNDILIMFVKRVMFYSTKLNILVHMIKYK